MAIEFSCSGCGKTLRVADGAAGKQARCPGCGAIMNVPAARVGGLPGVAPQPFTGSTPPPFPQQPGGSPMPQQTSAGNPSAFDLFGHQEPNAGRAGDVNPFQSPQIGGAMPRQAYDGTTPLRPSPLDIGEVYTVAWKVFSDHAGKIILVGLVYMAIVFGLGVVRGIAEAIIRDKGLVLIFSGGFQLFVNWPMTVWLQCGLFIFCLRLLRGQDAEVSDLFAGGYAVINAIVGSLLVGLMVLFGLIFLVIPGIILGLMFSQFMILIVDRKLDVMEALKVSAEITRGNRIYLFLLALATFILAFFATVFTCCLGVVAVVPMGFLISATAYLMMSGQLNTGVPPNEEMPVLTPLR